MVYLIEVEISKEAFRCLFKHSYQGIYPENSWNHRLNPDVWCCVRIFPGEMCETNAGRRKEATAALFSTHPAISSSALQKVQRLQEFNASKSTNVIHFTDFRESENPKVCTRPPHLCRQEFQSATDVVWQTFLKAPIEGSKERQEKEKNSRPRLHSHCQDLFYCATSVSAIFSFDSSPVVSEIAQEESYTRREVGACFSGLSGSRAGDGRKLPVLLW